MTRRLFAYGLAIVLCFGAIGCPRVEKGCGVVLRAEAFLGAHVFPVLDPAVSVLAPPEWSSRYLTAKAGFRVAYGRIAEWCERQQAGEPLETRDIADTLGEAAVLASDLIGLWQEQQAAGLVIVPRAGAPDPSKLLADLAEVQREAAKAR